LKERYGDDPSTHPDLDLDLWLEAWLSGGLDRNQVYNLSNTTAKDLQMTCGVSTVGYSQLVPSTQTLEFEAILDQRVKDQMTHLPVDYEWLSVETTKLCWLIIDTRSQMVVHVLPLVRPRSRWRPASSSSASNLD
jgi:hypothetical protein